MNHIEGHWKRSGCWIWGTKGYQWSAENITFPIIWVGAQYMVWGTSGWQSACDCRRPLPYLSPSWRWMGFLWQVGKWDSEGQREDKQLSGAPKEMAQLRAKKQPTCADWGWCCLFGRFFFAASSINSICFSFFKGNFFLRSKAHNGIYTRVVTFQCEEHAE